MQSIKVGPTDLVARSSVLIIGHPDPSGIHFGVDAVATLKNAKTMIAQDFYPVVVLSDSKESTAAVLEFLNDVEQVSPQTQKILVNTKIPPNDLQKILNQFRILKILTTYEDQKLELFIQEALEQYSLHRQNAELLQLLHQQNQRLLALSQDLESRVQKRQRFLESAREKLSQATRNFQTLHRALVAVHSAQSVAIMERLLNEALSESFGLAWTRILFRNQSHLEENIHDQSIDFSVFSTPLMRDQEPIGHVFFARDQNQPFTENEDDFLLQVADAVALAVDRLSQLEQSESLKYEWETTFNAVNQPVAIITPTYDLVRMNENFAIEAHVSSTNEIGLKCYSALFGRKEPCEGCRLGQVFQLAPSATSNQISRTYNVTSTSIASPEDGRALFVNLYQDISEKLKLERKIMETAKSAELGLIGGSIAHELNNPMAGIITFLQLIRMDLNGDETYADDTHEMERGAQRCKEIIENMLGFARKEEGDLREPLDIKEVVRRAIKIVELKTRSLGIVITEVFPAEPIIVVGSRNLLAQSYVNILQSSIERILVRRKKNERHFAPAIDVSITASLGSVEIVIRDNGDTEKTSARNSGLGLTVAQHIFSDHSGRVVFQTHDQENSTIVTLVTTEVP